MDYLKEEVDTALQYAESVIITTKVSSDDEQSFVFEHEPEIPESLSTDVKELIELCLVFYQRIVFTGGYEVEEPKPKEHQSNNVLDDVNLSLEFYKGYFIYEVKKALGLIKSEVDKRIPLESDSDMKPKVSKYAQAMMGYRAQQRKKKKK